MFTTAIFDMDGLLLDSERPTREVWKKIITDQGLVFDHAFYLTAVGLNMTDTRILFREHYGAGFDYDDTLMQVRGLLDSHEDGYAVMPGVGELLAELALRGIVSGVASSTGIERVGKRLEKSGLSKHFFALTGGNEVKRGKPAPDIFLLAAERLGVTPANCLVFEDSSHGAMGALEAGMGVVVVPE